GGSNSPGNRVSDRLASWRVSKCASVRLEWNRLALDLRKRVHGGLLLGFFFVAAPGAGVNVAANGSGDFEALTVIGSLFVEELVLRRGPEFALGNLLQKRLIVAAVRSFRDGFNFRRDV